MKQSSQDSGVELLGKVVVLVTWKQQDGISLGDVVDHEADVGVDGDLSTRASRFAIRASRRARATACRWNLRVWVAVGAQDASVDDMGQRRTAPAAWDNAQTRN